MGPDGLHPRLLKQCASQLTYPLYIIFKSSITHGCVPDDWKVSHVIPIYKKGSRSDPLNYRPISLTPIPCKSLERLVSHALFGFLEDHSVLDNSQFGFRAGRSVSDQMLLTYNKITQWYDRCLVVDLILFDFVKAFDRVHHRTLLDKLLAIGITGNLWRWISSFLTNRRMLVSVSGSLSSDVNIASGVPQGSVLGPLLFIIFVNHICSSLTCNYMMFADDLKLYLQHPDNSSFLASPDLQHNINSLASTSASWGLQFAPQKCVHIRFRRGRDVDVGPLYFLDGVGLRLVDSHKDLGITVDNKLRFHAHIRQTVAVAGGIASNLLKSTVCRTPSFMKSLLISDIRPLLDFASPVWNTGFQGDFRLLESVQRRWTKQVLNMSNLSYQERLLNLNLFSIKGRLIRSDLIMCYKIFHDLSIIKPLDLFIMAPVLGTRGHSLKIFHTRTETEARRRFFSCRIVELWNSLPRDVVEAPTLNQFKSKLATTLHNLLFNP